MAYSTSGELKGRVTDANVPDHPLEYATISVYSKDSSLISGIITDNKGTFSLELNPGEYYAVIQFISYTSDTISNISITEQKPVADVGTIKLKLQTTQIEEAVVIGEKSSMVIDLDKKVFNVGKDLNNAGKSASEILDNIPSVTVDAEGNVSLRGSQNLQILVDGRPSGLVSAENTDALRSLQGNLIDRVEVITNPSSRYEAEGMAGIINLVLKKDQRKGVNGSFELSAGYPHEYSLGANISFRREKINYFLNYGLRYFERPGEGNSFQRFSFPDTSYLTRVKRDPLRSGWSHNVRIGADFNINEKNILTFSSVLGFEDQINISRIWYEDYTISENLLKITSRRDEESETEKNVEFSLNYLKNFDRKNQKFNFLAQYINEGEIEESDIREGLLFHFNEEINGAPLLQKSLNDEGQQNILLQADYEHPLNEDGKVETGIRSEFRKILNPYSVEEIDSGTNEWQKLPQFSNNFEYIENVYAAYIQIGNTFNNISIQAGLRSELSDIQTYLKETDNKNRRRYTDFFPSFHTSYKFNEKNSVQISYTRRINRPGFWSLNPFYTFSDSRNIRTGNPDLEPEYTNSFETGYILNIENFSFYAGLYYNNTQGVIERINYVDTTGTSFQIPFNLSERNSFGFESNISINPLEWWKLNTDFNFYRAITEGNYNGESLNSDSYSWNLRLDSKMNFKNNLDFQTTFFYRAPQTTTQGERKAFYMMNIGLSKDILKGNGTITFNVRDLLNSRKFSFILDSPELYSENEFRWSTRSFSLTFMYRLNQNKKQDSSNGRNDQVPDGSMDF